MAEIGGRGIHNEEGTHDVLGFSCPLSTYFLSNFSCQALLYTLAGSRYQYRQSPILVLTEMRSVLRQRDSRCAGPKAGGTPHTEIAPRKTVGWIRASQIEWLRHRIR